MWAPFRCRARGCHSSHIEREHVDEHLDHEAQRQGEESEDRRHEQRRSTDRATKGAHDATSPFLPDLRAVRTDADDGGLADSRVFRLVAPVFSRSRRVRMTPERVRPDSDEVGGLEKVDAGRAIRGD